METYIVNVLETCRLETFNCKQKIHWKHMHQMKNFVHKKKWMWMKIIFGFRNNHLTSETWNVDWKHIFHKFRFQWKTLSKWTFMFPIPRVCFEITNYVFNHIWLFSNYKFRCESQLNVSNPILCFQTTYFLSRFTFYRTFLGAPDQSTTEGSSTSLLVATVSMTFLMLIL